MGTTLGRSRQKDHGTRLTILCTTGADDILQFSEYTSYQLIDFLHVNQTCDFDVTDVMKTFAEISV